MYAPAPRRLQRQDRGADIAAHLHVESGGSQQMRGQRRRGRFAVGAGDGDERRDCGALRRRSRQNSSMSPITSTAAARASPTVQCGAGWVSGTPGASTSAAIFDQSTWRRSAVGNAGAGRLRDRVRIVVPADDVGPAGEQRAGADQSRAAEPEHGDLSAGEAGDRDHQRSFSVDRPTSASTTEMIQNRITICGSVQPFCSKW